MWRSDVAAFMEEEVVLTEMSRALSATAREALVTTLDFFTHQLLARLPPPPGGPALERAMKAWLRRAEILAADSSAAVRCAAVFALEAAQLWKSTTTPTTNSATPTKHLKINTIATNTTRFPDASVAVSTAAMPMAGVPHPAGAYAEVPREMDWGAEMGPEEERKEEEEEEVRLLQSALILSHFPLYALQIPQAMVIPKCSLSTLFSVVLLSRSSNCAVRLDFPSICKVGGT